MTTEGGPTSRGDRVEEETKPGTRERTAPRTRELTILPHRGTVLVRSAGPPEVPAVRCVDVRPGSSATFDGDRVRMSLSVSVGDERRRFERSELPAIEDAVVEALGTEQSTVEDDTWSDPAVEAARAVLRFGDRAACIRMLPTPAVEAIERRLAAAAGRASSALVTWTTGVPRPLDDRGYDVVLDPPVLSE